MFFLSVTGWRYTALSRSVWNLPDHAIAGVIPPLLALAILLSSGQMAALRGACPWLGLKIDQTEMLWPAVDMVHVVLFGSLGLLLVLAFPAVRLRVLYLALAALAEVVQIWIPGRTASVGEVLLDLVAGGLGMGVAWLIAVGLGWRRATSP